MAEVIKLPARANAIDYDEDAVADAYYSLVGREPTDEDADDGIQAAAQGEGVVIDEAQDSESKARVRCRTMAKLLADGRDPAEDDDDDEGRDPIKTRTHVVPSGDTFLPVLSLKA